MSIYKNIPNIISISRVFLSSLFLFYISNDRYQQAAIVVLIAGLTDFLDGYLARKFKVESKFGQILDPIADKVFLNIAIWGMYFYKTPYQSILYLAIFLTARDIILLIGGVFAFAYQGMRKNKIETSPVLISKICTTIIFFLMLAILVFENHSVYSDILAYTCSLLTVISFIIYGIRFVRSLIR